MLYISLQNYFFSTQVYFWDSSMLLGATPVQPCSPEQSVLLMTYLKTYPFFCWKTFVSKLLIQIIPQQTSLHLFLVHTVLPFLTIAVSFVDPQTEQIVLSLSFGNSWFTEADIYLRDSALVYLRIFNLENGALSHLGIFFPFKINSGLYFRPAEVEMYLGKKSSSWRSS